MEFLTACTTGCGTLSAALPGDSSTRSEFIINNTSRTADIPVWERLCLTIEEASAYSLIGENRLRAIIENNQHADFILHVGSRTRIKRKEFETYVSGLVSI